MTTMPVLVTERLTIRPFGEDDVDAAIAVLEPDRDATEGARAANRRWREQWVRWSATTHQFLADLRQPPYGDRAVVLTATGRLIGAAGLVPSFGPFAQLPSSGVAGIQRYTPELGLFYRMAPDVRGRGYATEAARALVTFAFDVLNAARVVATTTYDNEASMAVMRKLGMRIERNPYPTPAWFQVVGIVGDGLEVQTP
jgi:RimJ/RimL family protein N-acetyltransferase